MSGDFPPEIEQFIQQHVESLAQLEVLLLLRQDSHESWDGAAVSKVLLTSPEECAAQLAELTRRGILEAVPPSNDQYRYRPADAALDALIGKLAEIYRERRVSVITLIYSKPSNKVQTFADAFRLRKEK